MTVIRRYAQRTRVDPTRSRAAIETLLHRYGCSQYGTAIDNQARVARVQFRAHDRIVRFVLALPDPAKYATPARLEQEDRRVWRALLLVIRAKLEAVDSGIATFEQEFLAQIVLPNDQTVDQVVAPLIAESYARGRLPRALLAAAADDGTEP